MAWFAIVFVVHLCISICQPLEFNSEIFPKRQICSPGFQTLGVGFSKSGEYFATVYAIQIYQNNIYAGGDFTNSGDTFLRNIAMWNGTTWQTLGTGPTNGTSGEVYAMAEFQNSLFVGGNFVYAGGIYVRYLAKWNGTSWSGVGLGVSALVRTFHSTLNNLYIGGKFSFAYPDNDTTLLANKAVIWDGQSFIALGTGLGNDVYTINSNGSKILFGGTFTNAGQVLLNSTAQWNGITWSPLGFGINDIVFAIEVNGSELFAGTGANANKLVKNNGTTWNALSATVINLDVYCLKMVGNDLLIGGAFTFTTNQSLNFLMKWNGSTLVSPESRINSNVKTIFANGTDYFVGGSFTSPGFGVLQFVSCSSPTPSPSPQPTPIDTSAPLPTSTATPTPPPTSSISQTTTTPSSSSETLENSIQSSSDVFNLGLIVGVIVAVVILILIAIVLILVVVVRRKKNGKAISKQQVETELVKTESQYQVVSKVLNSNPTSEYQNTARTESQYANSPNTNYANVPESIGANQYANSSSVQQSNTTYANIPDRI